MDKRNGDEDKIPENRSTENADRPFEDILDTIYRRLKENESSLFPVHSLSDSTILRVMHCLNLSLRSVMEIKH